MAQSNVFSSKQDVYKTIPGMPDKISRKKKKPKLLAVVREDGCTGCEACVPFCPVDCIEHVPRDKYPDVVIPPVQIRFDECIGCQICARVCEKSAWDTIDMVPTAEVEKEFGIEIGEKYIDPASDEEEEAA